MEKVVSNGKGNGSKKIIENLVLILILSIIVIVVMNVLAGNEENLENKNSIQVGQNVDVQGINKSQTLEQRMEEILSVVEGAGKVRVLITYAEEKQQIPMVDTKQGVTETEEQDTNGGVRKTKESSKEEKVIYEEIGNTKTPVMKQIVYPQVIGVVVVADGAKNLAVKENLIRAVEAVCDVPSHKIQVFASNG